MVDPGRKRFSFTPTHKTLHDVLLDRNLAPLGDAYTNLIYSLFLSAKRRKPTGAKADSYMLSNALRKAELRKLLPSRIDRHKQADAAETLLVYVWLHGLTTVAEDVEIVTKHDDGVEAFSSLLSGAKRKLNL